LVGPREIGAFYYLKLLYKIQPEERDLPGNEVIAAAMEGEKVRKIAAQVEGDAGDEYRRLARRLWESEDGERVVAYLLKGYLSGALRASAPKRVRNEDSRREEREDRDSRDEERGDGGRRRRRRERDGDGDRGRSERRSRSSRDRDDESGEEPRRRSRSSRDRDDESGEEPRRRRRRRRRRDSDEVSTRSDEAGEASGSEHDAETVVMNAETETVIMAPDAVSNMDTVVVPPSSELLEASSDDDKDDKDDKKKTKKSKKDDDKDDKKKSKKSKKDDDKDDKKKSRRSKKSKKDDKEFWEAWADEKQSRADTENGDDDDESAGNASENEGNGDETVRLYVNIGKREELDVDEIRALLSEGLDDAIAEQIGSIALRNTHCYVRVPEDLVDAVISGAEGKSVRDRDVVIERARR
jgi:hypothetical protein